MPTITIDIPDETFQELQRKAKAEGLDVQTLTTLALILGTHGPEKAAEMLGIKQGVTSPTQPSAQALLD